MAAKGTTGKGEGAPYALQFFPKMNAGGGDAASVETCPDIPSVFAAIRRHELILTERDIPFSEWQSIIRAKRAGTWTPEQEAKYDGLKARASAYRCVNAPDDERATRGNVSTAWALMFDVDGGRWQPKIEAARVMLDFRCTVGMFGSASCLDEPGLWAVRYVVPLNRAVDEPELNTLYEGVAAAAFKGGGLDARAKEIGRMWLAPTRHECGPVVDRVMGTGSLNVDALLRKLPKITRAKRRTRASRPRLQPAQLQVEARLFVEQMRWGFDFADRKDFIIAGMAAKAFGAEQGDEDLLFDAWAELSAEAWRGRPLKRPYRAEWATFKVEG